MKKVQKTILGKEEQTLAVLLKISGQYNQLLQELGQTLTPSPHRS